MLTASTFLLLAASANAAWVRPEARFAAPSGTACQYVCPAIAGLVFTEDTAATTTTSCNYFGPVSEERLCVYDQGSSALIPSASTAENCPPNTVSNGQCPSQDGFAGNLDGAPGTYEYYYWTTSGKFPSTAYCRYFFKSTAMTVPYGACSYDNAAGALTGQTFAGDCPTTAGQECGGNGRRRRRETTLEKVVRARQYKFSQPAARD